MEDISTVKQYFQARHEVRKALASRQLENVSDMGVGLASDVIKYVGNKVLDGLNQAYQHFDKSNINLLQITNNTSCYMGHFSFKSAPLDKDKAEVYVVAPVPTLIDRNTIIDAVYRKGVTKTNESGTAVQYIDMSSKDGQKFYQLEIEMHLTSIEGKSNDSPWLKICFYKIVGDEREKLIETDEIRPGYGRGIMKIGGSPFSIAATVTVGASSIAIIEHE